VTLGNLVRLTRGVRFGSFRYGGRFGRVVGQRSRKWRDLLAGNLERPVLNHTNVQGNFDFRVGYSAERADPIE
jgi:hypothetical protein